MRAVSTRLRFLLDRMGESVGAWMGDFCSHRFCDRPQRDFRNHRFCDQTATASCVHVREKLIGSRPLHLPKQEVWTIVFDWA